MKATAPDWPEGAQLLFDTAPLIHWLEGNPLAGRFAGVFAGIDALRWRGIVTPVTLAEIVAGPLRHGRHGLAEQYRMLLTSGPRFQLRALDADLALFAARLRVEHGLKLPDAIQLATAVSECCDALVTHDRDFPVGAGVEIYRGDAA
jgi:predicted nucleic acid-binding protein